MDRLTQQETLCSNIRPQNYFFYFFCYPQHCMLLWCSAPRLPEWQVCAVSVLWFPFLAKPKSSSSWSGTPHSLISCSSILKALENCQTKHNWTIFFNGCVAKNWFLMLEKIPSLKKAQILKYMYFHLNFLNYYEYDPIIPNQSYWY